MRTGRPEDSVLPSGVRWGAEHHYRMLGTEVCIRSDRAEVAGVIDHLLAPFRCWATLDIAHRYSLSAFGLHRDGLHVLPASPWPTELNWLLSDLNQVAVDGFDGLAVHAGVVARGGVAVAFPGSSDAGKSTLTGACLAAGFEYLSDEALCIAFDQDDALPYPKPLRLSRHGAALLYLPDPGAEHDNLIVLPEDLGATVADGARPLGHVVQIARRPGAPVLQPLDRSESVAALLSMSFNHYRHPLPCFSVASRLAAGAKAWRLEYDHPRPAALLLKALLDVHQQSR